MPHNGDSEKVQKEEEFARVNVQENHARERERGGTGREAGRAEGETVIVVRIYRRTSEKDTSIRGHA